VFVGLLVRWCVCVSPPIPLPSLPLEVGPPQIQLHVGDLGERRELPQRNRIWCILALEYDIIGGNSFNYFPENQLTKFKQKPMKMLGIPPNFLILPPLP